VVNNNKKMKMKGCILIGLLNKLIGRSFKKETRSLLSLNSLVVRIIMLRIVVMIIRIIVKIMIKVIISRM
jgi:hypothetical protein